MASQRDFMTGAPGVGEAVGRCGIKLADLWCRETSTDHGPAASRVG
jgi:hypothetical protein